MPEPFQPKFVDLVRNTTTTQGTGNLVLGPAVAGFTSFASALQAGDQFYYAVAGVDKPAEREVGRGTMLANGNIERDPIGGPKTNFTSGTKHVSLIAAAEWFTKVESLSGLSGGDGSGPAVVASRAALATLPVAESPALLLEAGREGLFVFDSSNLSAKVSADSSQGIYVAPAQDPSGTSGAWVRRFDGKHDVRWFGIRPGNSASANDAAIAGMLSYLQASATGGYGFGKGGPVFFAPSGVYNFSQTIDLTVTTIIEGESIGEAGGGSTVFQFASGVTGIRVQRHDTVGATGTKVSIGHGGDGSTIRNLHLKGSYGGAEGEFHGIHLRARATIRDCFVDNFQGDAIRIAAWAGGSGDFPEGNANSFEVTRCFLARCRNGLYVAGADANAGIVGAVNAMINRAWGIQDESFLGNTYIGCHTSGNAGGAYRTTNVNASNQLLNCYSEGDQPGSDFASQTLVIGGAHGAGISGGIYLRASTNGELVADTIKVTANLLQARTTSGQATRSILFDDSGTNYFDSYTDQEGSAWAPLAVRASATSFRIGGDPIAEVNSDGISLASGKVLKSGTATIPITNSAPSKLIGRGDGGAGPAQEISLGAGLSMTGTTLVATGGGGGGVSDGDKGDVTVSAGGTMWSVESATPPGGNFAVAGNLVVSGELALTSGRTTGLDPHVLFNVSKEAGNAGVFAFRRPAVDKQVLVAFETGSGSGPDGYFGTLPDQPQRIYFVSGGGGGGSFAIDGSQGLMVGSGTLGSGAAGGISPAGAITGASLSVTGTLSGSNFSGSSSGTNTGDQTITLSGDVTGSGTGSFAATIANNAVGNAKLRQSSALSVIGRSANSTGDVADIAAGSDGHVLRRSGTTLGFGTIPPSSVSGLSAFATGTDAANLTGTVAPARIADNSLPAAKLANPSAASRLLGRRSGSTGAWEEVSVGSGLSMSSAGVLSATGGGGGMGPNVTAFDSGSGPTLGTTEATIGTVSLASVPAGTPVLIMARVGLLKDSGTTVRTSTVRVRRGSSNSDVQIGADCGLRSQGVASSDYGPGVILAVDSSHSGGNLTYTIRGLTSAASGSTTPNYELAAIPLTLAA